MYIKLILLLMVSSFCPLPRAEAKPEPSMDKHIIVDIEDVEVQGNNIIELNEGSNGLAQNMEIEIKQNHSKILGNNIISLNKNVGSNIESGESNSTTTTDKYATSLLIDETTIVTTTVRPGHWPNGTYGIPKAKVGCPGGITWSEGSRYHDNHNEVNPNNTWSSNDQLYGSHTNSDGTQHFCMKTDSNAGAGSWPLGQYCIFKYNACPTGFSEGRIRWDDEDVGNSNSKTGYVPTGTYNTDTYIDYCCKRDGSCNSHITLPTEKPFYLIRFGSHCQKVARMTVSETWFEWHTDCCGSHASGSATPSHTKESELRSGNKIRIDYCYYQ